jgi:hypothetical protein
MKRIVTTTYRYKRPTRKRKPVAREVPTVVHRPRRAPRATQEEQPEVEQPASANEDPTTPPERKSAIVTIRRRGRIGYGEDPTPEELLRRADAADAIIRDFKRELARRHRK